MLGYSGAFGRFLFLPLGLNGSTWLGWGCGRRSRAVCGYGPLWSASSFWPMWCPAVYRVRLLGLKQWRIIGGLVGTVNWIVCSRRGVIHVASPECDAARHYIHWNCIQTGSISCLNVREDYRLV
eukprot:1394286-Amorphochlora_amoeboformis.AAC.1